MRGLIAVSAICFFALSCKMQSNSESRYGVNDDNKVYKLRLNPAPGSIYYYDIVNESEVKLEVNDKKIDKANKIKVGLQYEISKDSLGNFLFKMTYDKIQLHSKNDDTETDFDAANASSSIDPSEKMLGILKSATIMATISPAGDVKAMDGFKEMTDQLLAGLNTPDSVTRSLARAQLEQVIEKGLIKKNIEQFLRIFPDSAVHIGDKWRMSTRQSDEFNLTVKSFYRLKEINDNVAVITCTGEIASDSSNTVIMGNQATADLSGKLEGEYKMETKTGMLIKVEVTTHVEGTVQMVGRNVPIEVKSTFNITNKEITSK